MERFKLITDDVFEQDGVKIKVNIAGIDLDERFKENPAMLYGHVQTYVLGFWTDILKSEKDITAIPDFDEDEQSKVIMEKVRRGSLKSASSKLIIKDKYFEGDVLIINKSILYEASIVAIPANANAKIVGSSSSNVSLSFSEGGDAVNIKKLKEEIMSDKKVNEELNSLKSEKVELSLKLETSEGKLEKTLKTIDELNLSLESKDAEIEKLKAQIEKDVQDKKQVLIDKGLELGLYSEKGAEAFLDLSYEQTKSIIENLKPVELSLSAELNSLKLDADKGEKNKNKDKNSYEFHLMNGSLSELKEKDPAKFSKLKADYEATL